jgi:predicted enzyme related to lactoylglutathione lyase
VRDGCRVHLSCTAPLERDQKAFEAAEHLDRFGVEGAEALAKAFGASGAAFSVALRTMPYGREFYVRDPDGYILGFIQPADSP